VCLVSLVTGNYTAITDTIVQLSVVKCEYSRNRRIGFIADVMYFLLLTSVNSIHAYGERLVGFLNVRLNRERSVCNNVSIDHRNGVKR
jgi:hypothetical protein